MRDVSCVTCRACDVARATDQSGHDLGDEHSVAKGILMVRFLRSVPLRLVQAVAKAFLMVRFFRFASMSILWLREIRQKILSVLLGASMYPAGIVHLSSVSKLRISTLVAKNVTRLS